MRQRDRLGGLTMRAVLLLGFGLTFGVWLFAGSYFMGRVSDIETRTAEIQVRYMQAQELLSTVRAHVLLGSVYVRDALLDPDPDTDDYRQQLDEAYRVASRTLSQYEPVLDSSAERERVARLHQQMEDFRQTMLQVLATDSSRWKTNARVLLRTLVPKRDMVIRVSEEIQALNRTAFVQQQREVAAIYASSQQRLWQSLGAALVVSFGIALLVATYAGRLERRVREQQTRDAQLTQELQDLSARLITAQEEERRTIARELHDEVGQVLTAIKVELAVAQRTTEHAGAGRTLDDARALTEGALTTVRDISQLLHPAILDDLGLPATVEWYLRGFSRRFDIRAELVQDGMEERLAPDIELAAYRIVQEAVTNIARHARATTCTVRLRCRPAALEVEIEDNGQGFDEQVLGGPGVRSGLGLVGIRERASRLGGTVRLDTAPGKGVKLHVELPARLRAMPEASAVQVSAPRSPVGPDRETVLDG